MQARPPLPHNRHLLLGSRQGIHLPDARWHLWCLTLPTPPAEPEPSPMAAGLQMLPGRAVSVGGTVLQAAPATWGDNEPQEAI